MVRLDRLKYTHGALNKTKDYLLNTPVSITDQKMHFVVIPASHWQRCASHYHVVASEILQLRPMADFPGTRLC